MMPEKYLFKGNVALENVAGILVHILNTFKLNKNKL